MIEKNRPSHLSENSELRDLRLDVREQIAVNRSQFDQLRHLASVEMSQSFLYFLAAVFLAGGFVVSVLIYFLPGRIVAPSSLQELVPAGCVFLGFGLLQTLRAFIAHRNQAQEFRLLVARHGHAMQTAEFLLMDHEPKSQADE